MISESMGPLIADLIVKLSRIPKLSTAILYGSAARGELTETSDIDLLLVFDVPHNPETGGELEAAHRILGEVKTERKLQLVATNLKHALEPDFLDSMCREGIVIYGKPLLLTTEGLKLTPRVAYTYSMAGLSQLKKSRFQRALKGYRVVKQVGKRRYVSEREGLLKTLEVKKLGKGVLMVGQENSRAIEEVLGQHDIKYSKFKVWC